MPDMTEKKAFSKRVRESYGDTIEEFAKRLNTTVITVEGWEAGQEPNEPASALLKYSDEYALALFPRISEDFVKLSISEQLKLLMGDFGDTQKAFGRRIGICEHTIYRWMTKNIISPIAQRYIYEVAMYPERFQSTPKSYSE